MLRVIYQIVSFAAILISIITYQKLKEKQREEKENILLAEQIENTKQHISEVEKLYEDIRALKHDMGNHICVLENLFCKLETEGIEVIKKEENLFCQPGAEEAEVIKKEEGLYCQPETEGVTVLKNERQEWKDYLLQLKRTWAECVSEIKTGNPVTDVILTQKQKEAKEKGIDFHCQFIYPTDTNINAFDVSVILNNAIENAIEGVRECNKPCVSIVSYRRKNAYMLEVTNCISKKVEIAYETGLPETTKNDKDSHGYGLSNIRKVAQKYYGDIDIRQEEKSFTLTVMLMVK